MIVRDIAVRGRLLGLMAVVVWGCQACAAPQDRRFPDQTPDSLPQTLSDTLDASGIPMDVLALRFSPSVTQTDKEQAADFLDLVSVIGGTGGGESGMYYVRLAEPRADLGALLAVADSAQALRGVELVTIDFPAEDLAFPKSPSG